MSNDHYLRKTASKISKRVLDHAVRDSNSHLSKHSVESEHPVVDMNGNKVIMKGFISNSRKLKVSEELLIKEMKPTLNK